MDKLTKSTKIMITILVIIVLGLLTTIVLMYMGNIKDQENKCSSEVDDKLCQVNTFKYEKGDIGTGVGKVRVTGYAKTREIPEEECVTEEECKDVKKIKYVTFYVTKTDSKEFKNYLTEIGDNNTIGLGCYKNNKISYINNSVYFGDKEFELNEEMAKKILESTSSSPITLDLEKLELGEAKGAPSCYSHMTYIKIAKEENN